MNNSEAFTLGQGAMTDIVFCHLLNDVSGSPRVLMSVIASLTIGGERAKLFIGSDGCGNLTHSGIPIKRYWYKRTGYRVLTLFTYFFSQFILFFKLLRDRSISPHAIIYVNTLLPFGAAIYGKLTGRKVIYHIHEISITPAPLKYLLIGIAHKTSDLNIYVSDAHIEALPIAGIPFRRVHNALDIGFSKCASSSIYADRRGGRFNILMVSSLRDYKGIPELLALAKAVIKKPEMYFDLVLNDDPATVDSYFSRKDIPENLKIHSRASDITPYYSKASLLLSLTRVDHCVETFGMTILEAMAFGIPSIVPPLGGPAELVKDGIEGFYVDSRDLELLIFRVLELFNNKSLCISMSQASRTRAADFSIVRFTEDISNAVDLVRRLKG